MQMSMMYLRDQAKAIGHGVNYGMGINSDHRQHRPAP
jgi:hypothetical protein